MALPFDNNFCVAGSLWFSRFNSPSSTPHRAWSFPISVISHVTELGSELRRLGGDVKGSNITIRGYCSQKILISTCFVRGNCHGTD